MITLGKDVLARIGRNIGRAAPKGDRLAFEAKVWRTVNAHVPGLGAEELNTLTSQILRGYAVSASPPVSHRDRPRVAA
ncbi:MAG: hypothetical protein EXQ95_15055 [Alphaproteobacteria bacterium]|nr:hypothetical protein [Alphaproteobacteria bacterium]